MLTFADVERAFHDGLAEERDLDWKAQVPSGEKADDEFTKDVTAMANTDGGVLIYGVSEDQRVVGLAGGIGDDVLRTLEQLLLRRTAPYIRDVQMQRLIDVEDASRGLLVVSVPKSVDAPHVVVGVPGVPKLKHTMRGWERRGSDSVEMDERALAQAYRRRFDSDANIEQRSTALRQFAADQCIDGSATAWLLIAGTPSRPAARPQHVERSRIGDRLAEAVIAGNHRAPNTAETLGSLRGIWDNPRTGYGRWVVSNFVAPGDSGVGRPCYVELHHDGTVVAAVDVSWHLTTTSDNMAHVEIGAVERGVSEIVSLADIHCSAVGAESTVDLSAELVRADSQTVPFMSVRTTLNRQEFRDSWTRPIRRAQVVRAEMAGVRGEAELASTVYEVADGILSQFGVMTELARPI